MPQMDPISIIGFGEYKVFNNKIITVVEEYIDDQKQELILTNL